ncbi:MAG: 5-formyltetrahydrofolate cyclo-ligase [Phycisphaerales bacterium]|nr:5-formyltetrahydrofolate cyclo-ligase [Phycisphaerales bacterium]
MTDTARDRKASIRSAVRRRLLEMTPDERRQGSADACARLAALPVFRRAGTVMLYMSLADEVDVTPLAIRCFQAGKTVCVPRVNWQRRDIQPVEAMSFDDDVLDTDEHGIRTPRDGRPVLPETIDLVVVPGVAFDTLKHRLGRGGGFYDRFLPALHRRAGVVAIAFDLQVVDAVPTEDWDLRVHHIVTDARVI